MDQQFLQLCGSRDGDHCRVQRVPWGISPSSRISPISGLDLQRRLYSRSVQISGQIHSYAMRMFSTHLILFQIYTFRSTVQIMKKRLMFYIV
ncbi:uncharacterized protein LOC131315700 isoform X2 [Rhododendron vialii]|uniref:uncharacterized protein LOC131315700 isoform X2 n=1 Tax=Rhododendron vialii TaxID=182163 RepID=UPI00265DF6D6|nr:uncharacterized protein LOC131315700 isoform X2 [Rhododendron vialii]